MSYSQSSGPYGRWSYGSGLALTFHVGDLVQVLSGELPVGSSSVTICMYLHAHFHTSSRMSLASQENDLKFCDACFAWIHD